ncbi:hypothetical protein F511_31782 [Dorcoceras hygrometricum]|uniref:Uncharacterized protein n=1 Tax=Dorcoceras hygrometricum TaxID=472368 RepID=A0A2Z7BT05_9LAMI|nr:hypothetical protein F511_31782 [Dorcoceras hygrometricum]
MESPRRGDRNKSDHEAGGGRRRHTAAQGVGRRRIQLAVGPQLLRLRNHNFGLAHRIMVKRLATSPHDFLGITDSACKNQLVVVSVQYGPFNTYIPIRSTTIGKSRVARDPIAMHTSWRSNSDIASVTSFAYVEPSVDRYAYVEQLYLLLVVSRKEKLEKMDSAVEVFSNDDGAVTRIYDVRNISRQLSGISDDDVSSDVITISRWIKRSAKEKLLTDEKNKGEVELLSAVSYSTSSHYGSLRQSGPRPDPRLLRQAALEELTRSARTDSPHRTGRKQFSGDNRRRRVGGGGGGGGGG